MSKALHYGVVLLLLGGGLVYWWMKPPSLNPMNDPQAAQALALVHTHRAVGYPTILQAFNERARIQQARNLGLRLGEWQVIKQDGQRYEVRIYMREQGTTQWFERDFIWHVDLATKRVNAASLPADGLMPEGPESGRPRNPAANSPPLSPTM
ncbi:MAG: esterase-like activity of phytase family protein [Nitrospirota bacterium]|nr:esterase-like activity of phytase family protein [Nitrospirota bacterium]